MEFEVLDLEQERGKVELKEDFIRLRAHDQVTLERKLDALQAALETRR